MARLCTRAEGFICHHYRLIYTSVQIAGNQLLGESLVTGNLRLLFIEKNEIHSGTNNFYHFLQISSYMVQDLVGKCPR